MIPKPEQDDRPQQAASHVLLVRPAAFFANPQTAETNAFQTIPAAPEDLTPAMNREFDGLVALLRDNGVEVTTLDGPPGSPDAVFPNNIFSTHADGRAALYPLLAENRFAELTHALESFLAPRYPRIVNYRDRRDEGAILEGTGSLVLDRRNAVAYAALSPRTSLKLAEEWCADFGYALVAFTAQDMGKEVYHTNVLMFAGTSVASICLDSITEGRARVEQSLAATGHEIIPLSTGQMSDMCGNALEVRDAGGKRLLVMSSRAWDAYSFAQKSQLRGHYAKILHTPLDFIETYGGGSARCMIAEIFSVP